MIGVYENKKILSLINSFINVGAIYIPQTANRSSAPDVMNKINPAVGSSKGRGLPVMDHMSLYH